MTESKTPPSLLSHQIVRRAYELLADGKWHDYERTLAEVGQVIPPGVASRRTEQDRAKQGAPPKRKVPRPAEVIIRSGRRALVRDYLSNKKVYEIKDGKIRLIGTPIVIITDRRRGEYLLPALDSLAEAFFHKGMPEAFTEVQQTAHEHGLHLVRCPRNCTLTPRRAPDDTGTED